MSKITRLQARNAGYTLDQTILIVAIIAILITLIVATIGWELLNRAGGTKLASQLRQIEDANGLFFSTNGFWPHAAEAIIREGDMSIDVENEQDSSAAVNGLVDSSVFACPGDSSAADDLCNRILENHANLLPGFDYDATVGELEHGFGGGGLIRQREVDTSAGGLAGGGSSITSGNYLVVQFDDVPMDEAEQAEQSIDGRSSNQDGWDNGRLLILRPGSGSGSSDDCDNPPAGANAASVKVCYIANLVNN